jgi:hypothetical protein
MIVLPLGKWQLHVCEPSSVGSLLSGERLAAKSVSNYPEEPGNVSNYPGKSEIVSIYSGATKTEPQMSKNLRKNEYALSSLNCF